MKKIVVVMLLLSFAFAKAQDRTKIKGNKEVTKRIIDVDMFESIEIGGDYEIAIAQGTSPQVEIITDSNIQPFINILVQNGNLTINQTAEIRRSKELKINIIYTEEFTTINVKDDAQLSSLTDLRMDNLQVNLKDDARVYLTGQVDELVFNGSADSRAECNLSGSSAQINLSGSSNLKALTMYDRVDFMLTDRAESRMEGDLDNSTMVLEGRSKMEGKNLEVKDLKLKITRNADAQVNAKDNLELRASGDAKVELYNNPKIGMAEFTGKAMLMKK
ncbi:GIN domain-containing protein [Nonlabens ponticola]|uniref:Putative auto-transporter adhesin head GIN domain-containing protein n=1 Tax=Nonlabens ponticola TaxID=2496866 RepID=A0A3S9MXJ7_9FLAO|nr:DUF2807 domain-containing protein [Nonlabens ponticola]AZQ43996.1 hypothetical protein EJ995_07020 [Nonlabens ponticola]